MTHIPLTVSTLTIDTTDPERMAAFYGALLGWDVTTARGAPALAGPPDVGFGLRFAHAPYEKWGPNQMHPDLLPDSLEEQRETVERALAHGARHLDIGQGPEAENVVLADPEGNEVDVLEPGSNFLAGCPFYSSLAGDGLAEIGYFWRDALGWPLVWDQDGETAVQAPWGGPKITWGGDPVAPKLGKNRLHLDLAVVDSTPDGEVARLLALGATRTDVGCAGAVGLADPGGNELCVIG
ncbi:VOC family protein [Nocardioides aestuarii]|uniref:VOC family protein n=1 Tax=Nocardioides aestuarii TaxID=252231 RepID=A0ABW4TNV1_9ACTN